MNAAQVRAKARMAMKRREEEIEDDEMEGGELNLVPYLDIVTNLMLFLLATVTAGMILGNINIGLPEAAGDGSPGSAGAPAAAESEEPPLDMVAVITRDRIRFFSSSGEEGSLDKPLLEVARRSEAELRDIASREDACKDARGNKVPAQQCTFDFLKLTEAAMKLVERHGWKDKLRLSEGPDDKPVCLDKHKAPPEILPMDKCRPAAATEVLIAAGADIPYHEIISVMDSLRQAPPPNPQGAATLLFPDVIFVTDLETSYTE